MPRFIVDVWETRSFEVVVDAADADEAKEMAVENYEELSCRDEFVSVEFREIEELKE